MLIGRTSLKNHRSLIIFTLFSINPVKKNLKIQLEVIFLYVSLLAKLDQMTFESIHLKIPRHGPSSCYSQVKFKPLKLLG